MAKLSNLTRSLRVYNPKIMSDSGFITDLSDKTADWKRSIRRNGGFWRGDLTITSDEKELANFFSENLGSHFEERAGGQITWEGLIYEMDLTIGGMTYRRSLDTLYNYVSTRYNDEDGEPHTSAPASNSGSISRYGRREEIMLLDGYPEASAEGQRDAYLKENAWPWARMVGINTARGEEASLVIRPCGYIFTANWRYTTLSGGMDELSDAIILTAEADMEFLVQGGIAENTFQVKKEQNTPIRVWDLIQFYLELGDADQNLYRAYVDIGRRFNYKAIDPDDIQYYLRGGKVYNSAGGRQETNYWQLQPGVFRVMDSPLSKREYSPWFSDARDTFVDEVEYGDNMEAPALKTSYFEESGILAAQASYQRQLEQERDRKKRKKR